MPDVGRGTPLPAGAIPTDRVTLPEGTLVVTDLHLAPFGDERTERFAAWCDALDGVPVVVCLGDLFDMWIGRSQLRLPGSGPVFAAFRRLTERGTAVHFVPGNRDLIMGAEFEEQTGGTLHSEGFVADLAGGERAAFVHGDALCTLDRGYLKLRWLWRWPPTRFASRHAPLWFARWVGNTTRRASESSKPRKDSEERSIQRDAILAVAGATGAETIVCGHAHDVRDEAVGGAAGAGVRWIVVGAWEWKDDLLRVVGGGGLELGSSATIPDAAGSGPLPS